MKCRVCGGKVEEKVTDLSSALGGSSATIKGVNIIECEECKYTILGKNSNIVSAVAHKLLGLA